MNTRMENIRNIGIVKSNAVFFKAVACVMIIIHHYFHLSGIQGNILIYIISAHFGYIFVSLFFLLSGYGLTESESQMKSSFLKFVRKRLTRVFYPAVLINIFTIILYYICGYKSFSVDDVGLYILGVKLIDPVLWYVNVSLILYVFFWLSFRAERNVTKIIMLFVLSIIYMLVAHFYLELPGNLYLSVLSFPIGMCCSLFKYKIAELVSSKWFFVNYIIYVIVMLALFYFFHKMDMQIIKSIVISFILIPIYIFTAQFNLLRSSIFNFVGEISYEIYLVHMKVFVLMGLFFMNYRNLMLYIMVVILIAFILNKIILISYQKLK